MEDDSQTIAYQHVVQNCLESLLPLAQQSVQQEEL
jgi:hypothetical protein